MSDLISKKELYHKLGEAYNKGYLSWGANEIFKDIIGECNSVENKGDLISRQAVLDAIQKLNIPEDMCVFEIISHIEVAIATLPSVENKGTWRHYEGMLYCPKCGAEFYDEIMEYTGDEVPKHCPDCGADMRGKADEQT